MNRMFGFGAVIPLLRLESVLDRVGPSIAGAFDPVTVARLGFATVNTEALSARGSPHHVRVRLCSS
jgi:hypothetical protein